jgi:hypothetical protein
MPSPSSGCKLMLEQHERGPVPAGEHAPDTSRGLGDLGRDAGFGDDGQVAGLRTCGRPHAQVSGTLPGRADRVPPEGLIGDQFPERRQAIRRCGRQALHHRFLPGKAGSRNELLAFIVHVFDPGLMARDRLGSDSDRLTVARLSGVAQRHARWGDLTETGKAAGVAELREVAGGRGDLLAEVAGISLGTARSRGAEYEAGAGRGGIVQGSRCRRGPDPRMDRGGTAPRRNPAASSVQPTESAHTAGPISARSARQPRGGLPAAPRDLPEKRIAAASGQPCRAGRATAPAAGCGRRGAARSRVPPRCSGRATPGHCCFGPAMRRASEAYTSAS